MAAHTIKKSRVVIALFLILVVDTMGFGLVIPMLKPLFLDPKNSIIPFSTDATAHFYYGLVLAVYPLAVCVGTPIIGMLSDRFGRKKMLLFSLCGASLGLIFCFIAIESASIMLLLFGRALTGLSAGSKALAQAVMVDISPEEQRAKYLSVIAIALTVGLVTGPLIGGIFSSAEIHASFSTSTPFLIAALLSIAIAILFQLAVPETNQKQIRKDWSFSENIRACIKVSKQANVAILLVLFVLLELSWSLYFQSSAITLGLLFDYDTVKIGYFIAFVGLCMGIGLSSIFQFLLSRMSLLQLIKFSFILNAVGFAISLLFNNQWGYWIGSVPIAVGVGMAYTAILTVLSRQIASELQGWLMGSVGALLALSWVVTGLLSGFIAGLWLWAPILIGLLLSLCAIIFLKPKFQSLP